MTYEVVTTSTWRARLRARYETVLRDLGIALPTWGPSAFSTRVIDILAFSLAELSEGIGAARDAMSLDRAERGQLEELCSLLGVSRLPGTPSTVTLTVGAWSTGPVRLPKGSVCGDGTNLWLTTESVTIPAGSTATVSAACEVNGPTSAAAGTITLRLSSVSGWTSVTNAAAASIGTADETDPELRLRAKNSSVGSRSPWAVKSALERVAGVKKAIVYFNPRMQEVEVSGRTVPACGWSVWLWPSSISTDSRTRALLVLYQFGSPNEMSLPTSTGADGVRASRLGADGQPDLKGYWFVRDINMKVRVTITSYETGYNLSKVTTAVRAAVQAYFDSLTPGQTLRQNDILGRVAGVTGVGRATVTISDQDPDDDSWSSYSDADRTIDVADLAALYEPAEVL